MYNKYADASSALLFITVLLIRQYFFNLPTLPSLCSQCGHQQEETRLFVDPLHRASCISVLHFLRMFPYRASLYLHSQLISYTSAKHYGDEKCSYILQDPTADASHHWWVEKPDDGKTKTLTMCNRVDRRINIHLVCFRCFNAWWFNLDTFRSLSGDAGMCCTYFNRL